MTVAAVTPRISYNGDGTNTYFSYPFDIIDTSDIVVQITSKAGVVTSATAFLVDTDNQRVVYPYPPLSIPNLQTGEKIELIRVEPFTQDLDLATQGTFSAEDIETALDKLTMMVQQLVVTVESLQQQPATPIANYILPLGVGVILNPVPGRFFQVNMDPNDLDKGIITQEVTIV